MGSVGENLKRLRIAAGLTQHALAKKAGVSQQLISELEAGNNGKTIALAAFASALGVGAHEIDRDYAPVVSRHSEVFRMFDGLSEADKSSVVALIRRLSRSPD